MNNIPSSSRNSVRTFVASLLVYVVLTSQLAPMAMAFNASANRAAPSKTSNLEIKKSEASPEGRPAGSFAPVPMPLMVTAAAIAPIITATKVDSFPDPDGDGKVTPGQTITYSVTLTNTGPDPALNLALNDTVDPNTTIVPGSAVSTPIAFDETYNVVGNVRIQPNAAQGVLANDINPNTGNNSGLTASGPTSSTQGGQLTINSDGSFSYNPPAGFTGTDTFTYTVTSPNGTDTASVTLTVGAAGAVIWFINSSAPVGGDGRLTNPFNCYTGASAGAQTCFSDSAADEAGDSIFLFSGGHIGGNALLNNQKLIGQGASASLAALAGVTVEAYSDPLPATGGAGPTITTAVAASNAVALGQGNVLRGFIVGNTTGAKIFGSGFGILTVGNNASPDVILNGAGQALNLTNGTFVATSAFLSVATTSSNAQGINLSSISGMVDFGGTTVSGSTTQGILVGNSTCDVNFGNTSVSGGTDGISLQNNSAGTRSFGTLSISNNSGVGFLHAVGGGNVNVTGATLIPAAAQTAPVGTGIDIQSLAGGTAVSFAATTVNKGNAGIAVNLGGAAAANVGNVTFNSLAITTSNGAGLMSTGNTGQTNVTTNAGSIAATGGPGINITKAASPASPITLNFSAVSSTNSLTQGINIDRVSGNLTIGSTTIANPTGVGIQVQNTSAGGTMNFGNTLNNQAGGTGVLLGGNAGAITFVTLQITPDNGQRGLLAQNNTGTISSANGAINSTGTVALEITGASAVARTPLSMTLDDLVSTNSATLGVVLNFVSGNLTVTGTGTDTDIQNPSGMGIQVLNSGAGTLNFGDTVVNGSGGTGVVLGTAGNHNTGAVTFSDLDITPDPGQRALHGINNTGALTSTSGTISTTNQIAVEINGQAPGTRTPLNIQLTSVSALASGGNPANGIVLQNTSATGSPGGLRVLGNGGACNEATPTCTGGHIQNTTGGDVDPVTTFPTGTGVVLRNANSVSLTRIRINGNTNYGIHGLNVNAFALDESVVHGVNGTNVSSPFRDSSIRFDQLTGTSSITNSLITGGFQHNILIDNQSGTAQITVSGSTIKDTSNAQGDDGFQLEAETTAVVNAFVTNNSFSDHGGDHFNLSMINNADVDLTFTGNAFAGGHPIGLGQGLFILGSNFNGSFTYDISNNGTDAVPLTGNKQGAMIFVNKGSGTGTYNGRIMNNVIGNPAIVGSGSEQAQGLHASARGAGGSHTTLITGNKIRQYFDRGMVLEAGEGGPTFNATVTNNTVSNFADATNSLHGIHSDTGILNSDTAVVCMDLQDNLVATAGNEPQGGADIRLRKGPQAGISVRIPGLVGTNAMFADNHITAENPNATTVTVSGAGFTGGAACAQPTLPAPPSAPETSIDTAEPGDIGSPGAPMAKVTTPSNMDSITSRPFISSPRPETLTAPTKPAAQPSVTNPVVVDRGLRYVPKPKRAVPPTGDGLPTPPVIVGDNLTWNVGTLPAGASVTITFQVVVDNPFTGVMPQVSNQGTVTADGGISVLTDDPAVGGSNDPTITGVTVPPDLSVRDARVAEPTSGSTSMLFTFALSTPAPLSGITVNLSTADDTANGGDCASGNDYTTVSGGTVTFASGEQIKTFPVIICSDVNAEGDEAFFLNVNSAPGAVIVDGQGVGTITAANAPGTIMISELRTSGPAGAGDDFVEIYNNTDSPHTVPAGGYGLFKRGPDCNAVPVLIGVIPATIVIPARGHYLFVGSTYSLANYGGTGAAAGDQILTADIESDFNVGLFSTVDPLAISTATRLDAVGFGGSTGGVCDLLLEGTTLPPASGSTLEHSFAREFTLLSNDVPTPTDGNDNAADFTVVSTTLSTPVGASTPRLGAPGPENLASPNVKKFSQVGAQLIDPMVPQASSPNRARDTTSDPANNSTFGTLASRRKFVNNTGAAITRLRFRIYDITTAPSPPGTADLRARSSGNVTVTVTGGSMVTVLGTTVETPPAQPNSGGLNSSFAAGTVTLATPLTNGDSINLQFLFGVQQTGSFRVFVFVEALP